MNTYIVMTSSAAMPTSVKAHYRNVAVVETDGAGIPKMISPRARHLVRIVRSWERLHYGRNPKGGTAYERARREAEALAVELNAGRQA
jgi:hypothetical protein